MNEETFGGKAGEPVPEVDVEDVRAVWRFYREVEKNSPGRHVAIDSLLLASVCKPGADVHAVCYRQAQLGLLKMLASRLPPLQDSIGHLTSGGEFKDSAFQAIAKIPMEWIGNKRRQEFPFDVEQFIKLDSA
jgi:hypothetical protein